MSASRVEVIWGFTQCSCPATLMNLLGETGQRLVSWVEKRE